MVECYYLVVDFAIRIYAPKVVHHIVRDEDVFAPFFRQDMLQLPIF